MKKRFLTLIFTLTAMLCCIFGFSSCKEVEFKVSFMVDGAVYATINTNGEEIIKMPNDPEKEGFLFDGWYWDKDSWKKPFTANSLLDAPLSDNMSVYAKWSTIESLSQYQPSNMYPSFSGSSGILMTSWPLVFNDEYT